MNQSLYFRHLALVGLLFFGGKVFAHHPNEGSLTLDQLLKEAESQNLDIKEAEAQLKSSEFETGSRSGKLMPQLSIEGGPLITKFNEERNSGTAVYGKADWNLYRGGRDSSEIDKARIKSDLDRKRYEAIKSKVVREVNRIYYELLFLLEGSDLKEKAIEMNQEQMKLAKLKKSSGFTSNADVIEFELREATLNSDLKMFAQVIAEKLRELSVLLGRKDSSVPSFVKGHLIRESSTTLSKENILSRLKNSNIDIVEAQAELKMSEKEADIAKSGFLPSLDLETKYGKIANEEKVFTDNNNYSVMLKLSIPLFSGFETTNQTKSARSGVVARDAAASRRNLSVVAETENLFSQLTTLTNRLDLEEKNLSKSEDYYKITLGEYRRGVKNSPDMVGASERLLEARIRNLEYRKDYYITKLKIYELVSSDPSIEESKKTSN